MKIGDNVIMNNKYYVSDENKEKIFKVRSKVFTIGGTECMKLENYIGGYAVDGLTKIEVNK